MRDAERLPEDAERGDAFIGPPLRDVPSSGFSDSLSDRNTHQFSPHVVEGQHGLQISAG